jgi:hypothetical protein
MDSVTADRLLTCCLGCCYGSRILLVPYRLPSRSTTNEGKTTKETALAPMKGAGGAWPWVVSQPKPVCSIVGIPAHVSVQHNDSLGGAATPLGAWQRFSGKDIM